MPLVTTREMFANAWKGGYAVGAFTVNNMEVAQGVVDAAKEANAPVILQLSANGLRYARPAYLKKIAEAASEDSGMPICIHLDHGESVEMCKECVDIGFTSVMIDASSRSFEENITLTREVVKYAHDRGIVVEAELGRLAGIEDHVDVKAEDALFTNPDQAAEFVERSGCDSLAIAVGTSHGKHKFTGKPNLAFDILEKITALLPGYPLVLHGASSLPPELVALCNEFGSNLSNTQGIPEDLLIRASKTGVCKINTDTDLRLAFTAGVRRHFAEHPEHYDPREYCGSGRELVKAIAKHKMVDVYCCGGRASELLLGERFTYAKGGSGHENGDRLRSSRVTA
jgi:fructose-bisphosphate aldolase class II